MHSQFRITPLPPFGTEMFLAQKQLRCWQLSPLLALPLPTFGAPVLPAQRSDNEAATAVGREIKLHLFISMKIKYRLWTLYSE